MFTLPHDIAGDGHVTNTSALFVFIGSVYYTWCLQIVSLCLFVMFLFFTAGPPRNSYAHDSSTERENSSISLPSG